MKDLNNYESIINRTDIDVLYMLDNTNPSAKAEFIENSDLVRPNNEYGNLDINLVSNNLELIASTLKELESKNIDDFDCSVLKYLLMYNYRKNALVFATHKYNIGVFSGDTMLPALAYAQKKANVDLYGRPNPTTFYHILQKKLSQIDYCSDNTKALDIVKSIRQPSVSNSSAPFSPSQEVFDKFSEQLKSFMNYILKYIPAHKEFLTPHEVCNIANVILEKELSHIADGWCAVVLPEASYSSVMPLDKKIVFPGKRSKGDFSIKDACAVLVHEIGTHFFRAANAERFSFKPLAIGLPDYESFEEGLATACEQVIRGAFRHPGEPHYLSIGLSTFLNYNFREVYDIRCAIDALSHNLNKQQCFDSVQRSFRGTGILTNNKDLVYYNGAEKAWRYISDHINDPNLIYNLFYCGKTDMTNPQHIYIINHFDTDAGMNRKKDPNETE